MENAGAIKPLGSGLVSWSGNPAFAGLSGVRIQISHSEKIDMSHEEKELENLSQ